MRRVLSSIIMSVGFVVSGTSGGLAQGDTVAIGQWPPLGTFWTNVIAEQKNFYATENINADIYYIGDAAGIIQQVLGGSLHVGFPTCEAAIRAIDKGAEITIIGQTMKVYPFSIIGAPDVHSADELKGKTLMFAGLKSILTVVGNEWIESQGVQLSDIDVVHDSSSPNRYAALVNGVVSGAVLSQPYDLRALADGYTKLYDYAESIGEYAFVCMIAQKAWLETNHDAAKRTLQAVSKATDWWYDPANKEEAVNILATATKQDADLITKTYDYYHDINAFNKGLVVSQPSIEKTVGILKDKGEIASDSAYDKFVDVSFGD